MAHKKNIFSHFLRKVAYPNVFSGEGSKSEAWVRPRKEEKSDLVINL